MKEREESRVSEYIEMLFHLNWLSSINALVGVPPEGAGKTVDIPMGPKMSDMKIWKDSVWKTRMSGGGVYPFRVMREV